MTVGQLDEGSGDYASWAPGRVDSGVTHDKHTHSYKHAHTHDRSFDVAADRVTATTAMTTTMVMTTTAAAPKWYHGIADKLGAGGITKDGVRVVVKKKVKVDLDLGIKTAPRTKLHDRENEKAALAADSQAASVNDNSPEHAAASDLPSGTPEEFYSPSVSKVVLDSHLHTYNHTHNHERSFSVGTKKVTVKLVLKAETGLNTESRSDSRYERLLDGMLRRLSATTKSNARGDLRVSVRKYVHTTITKRVEVEARTAGGGDDTAGDEASAGAAPAGRSLRRQNTRSSHEASSRAETLKAPHEPTKSKSTHGIDLSAVPKDECQPVPPAEMAMVAPPQSEPREGGGGDRVEAAPEAMAHV